MNQTERKMLENLLDSLDRLFDRKCEVIDFYFLLFASEAVIGNVFPLFATSYSEKLNVLIRSGKTEEFQREEALNITDGLRIALSEFLPI